MSTLRATLRRISERLGFERDWYLILLGAFIGALTAFGAVAFNEAIEFVTHFCNHRQVDLSPWGLALIPAVGGLVTGLLVYFFSPEAKGHGVPQVMAALIRSRGVIPFRVGLTKVLASIATVGTGGSAGVEGPIVQVGATVGSVIGERVHIERRHMETLVGCGAAAAISSIFNAPIAGVFFVLEILLRDFSVRTIAPIVIASVLSNATTQALLGPSEAIFAPTRSFADLGYHFGAAELPGYFLLGIICALVAVGFAKALHAAEDLFERMRIHPIARPVAGAVALGLLGTIFMVAPPLFGGGVIGEAIPRFFGNGYETVRDLIEPQSYASTGPAVGVLAPLLIPLVALLVFKILATCATIGSGGSGGVFAPTLFMGTTAGAAFGVLMKKLFVMPEGWTPASYALIGMGAAFAAATHAPLTAILMLLELTGDPFVLLPIMFAAIVGTIVARQIDRDSIYTGKLRRTGLLIGSTRDHTIMRRIPVASCQVTPLPPEPVYPSDPLSKLITLHAYHSVPDFVVVDQDGNYVGLVTGADMRAALIDREAIPLLLVAELLRTDLPTISTSEHLDTAMDKFARYDVSALALIDAADGKKPVGLMARAKLLKRYHEALAEQ